MVGSGVLVVGGKVSISTGEALGRLLIVSVGAAVACVGVPLATSVGAAVACVGFPLATSVGAAVA